MNDDALALAIADVKAGPQVADKQLRNISNLAVKQLALETTIEQLDKQLKERQNELKRVSEIELPNAMIEAGMKQFELEDGAKISVQRIYTGSITDENRYQAFNWLDEHGHTPIIQSSVVVEFGKGERKLSRAIIQLVQNLTTLVGQATDQEMQCCINVMRALVDSQQNLMLYEQFVLVVDGLLMLRKNADVVHPVLKESVHWQTLRAFIREQMEGDDRGEFPEKLFGAYVIDKSKVTPKKEK